MIPYKNQVFLFFKILSCSLKNKSSSPMGWLPSKISSQQVWFCMSIFTLHLASFCFLLQKCSCQRQSHLTSKYSVTDVNEDCIIFCVTQRVFLFPVKPDTSQVLVKLSHLDQGKWDWFYSLFKHWSFSYQILDLLKLGSENKCPCLPRF